VSTGFTVRLDLPPRWFGLGRDDPGDWIGAFLHQELPGDLGAHEVVGDQLIDLYGIVEVTGAVDALAYVPEPAEGVRAALFVHPVERRSLFRRGPASYARWFLPGLRAGGAPVQRAEVQLPSGPAVRLRGTGPDELGRPVEQVLHVVVPPGAPGAVVLRMQWAPGRADADELAATADRIARDALVELL